MHPLFIFPFELPDLVMAFPELFLQPFIPLLLSCKLDFQIFKLIPQLLTLSFLNPNLPQILILLALQFRNSVVILINIGHELVDGHDHLIALLLFSFFCLF